jgi:hypothetical protein
MVRAKKIGLLVEDFIKLGYPHDEGPQLHADLIKGIEHNDLNMKFKFKRSIIKDKDEWESEKNDAIQEYKEISRLLRKNEK